METYSLVKNPPVIAGSNLIALHSYQGLLPKIQFPASRGATTHMKKPSHVVDIFLQPGDFYFGDRNTRIRTLLGSCISITAWHPQLLIGGMCHYMLPTRSQGRNGPLDGRYGDEALELFLKEIRATGTRPAEYEVKLFGGSNMFSESGKTYCPEINCPDPFTISCKDISCRNRRSARMLVERHGFAVKAENLGGTQPHNVLFDLWSGHVWIKRPPKGMNCPEKTCQT